MNFKRSCNLFVVLLAALTVLVSVPAANAQTVVVDDVICANTHYANSATSTSDAIDLRYWGKTYPGVYGAFPDSVAVIWDAIASGDTISVQVSVATAYGINAVGSYTVLDTISADETTFATIANSVWKKKDQLKVKITALGSGNAVTAANSKLWLKVRRFFTLSK